MAEININLNVEAFEKALKEVGKTLKGESGELTAAQKRAQELFEIKKATVLLTDQEKELQAKLNTEKQITKVLEEKINAEKKQATVATEREKTAIAGLQKQLAAVRLETQQLTLEKKKSQQAVEAEVGSLKWMEQEYTRLTAQAKLYNQTTAEGKANWEKQLPAILKLDTEIKKLNGTMGMHQRNVGNYKSAFDGLGFSIQQVGRELPSLAYGPRVFFSAISNNLPIVIDQIRIAKTELAALNAQGKVGVPIWKQVVGSIFSWQTAMVLGITALTLYGHKLVEWIGQLAAGKDATANLTDAQKEFRKEISLSIGESQVYFYMLENHNKMGLQQRDILKMINEKYGEYIGFLLTEESTLGDIELARKRTNNELAREYMLKAQGKELAEYYAKEIEYKKELRKLGVKPEDVLPVEKRTIFDETGKISKMIEYEGEIGLIIGAWDQLQAKKKEVMDFYTSEIGQYLMGDFAAPPDKKGPKGPKGKKEVDEYAKLLEEIEKLEKEHLESTFSDQDKEIAAVADKYDKVLSNALLSDKQRVHLEELMYQEIVAIGIKYNDLMIKEEERLAGEENKIRDKKLEDELKRITTRAKAEAKATADAAKEKAKAEKDKLKDDEKMFDAALELQRNLADFGFAIFENQKKKELELAGENAIRREQIEKEYAQKERSLAIAMAIINTAVAVTKALRSASPPWNLIEAAIALTAGIAQVATIQSQNFAKGEIDIQGPGTETSDSIFALLSKGETVTPADKTRKYKHALEAIHKDRFEEYVYVNYVLPEMNRDARTDIDSNTAQNMYENIKLKAELDDYEIRRKLAEGNYLSIQQHNELIRILKIKQIKR